MGQPEYNNFKNSWKLMRRKTHWFKTCEILQRWEIHSLPSLSQKIRKSQMHKLTLHLKELEKEQQIKPKPSRRREIIKIKVEINEIETQITVEQINETRSWFFE